MNISIILAHPAPTSFNHAIAHACAGRLREQGHTVSLHDLHAEGFDPLIQASELPRGASLPRQVAQHCEEISNADGLVFVHPNWWGMPPAVLVGWIDRVLRPGVAYEFLTGDKGEGVPRGLLKVRTAIVFNTANTPDTRERAVFGAPLESIWRRCVFGLCEVGDFHRRTFSVVVTSSPEQRSAWLDEARDMVERLFPAAEAVLDARA